jgi:hypothetical protein
MHASEQIEHRIAIERRTLVKRHRIGSLMKPF